MYNQQNLQNHIIRFRTLYCQKHILYLKKVIRYHKKTDLEHIYNICSIKLCLQSR